MENNPEGKAIHQRLWIWVVYILLFALSIPWYLPKTKTPELWFGMPYWVVLSLGATFSIACFTAVIVHLYWHCDDEAGE